MKYAIGPRKEIGVRTIFNIIGPLTNPAGALAQVVGVYDPNLTEPLAKVLSNLGTKKAFVVHGFPLDEISTIGPTKITEVQGMKINTYTVYPGDFGMETSDTSKIAGGTAEENATILTDILSNKLKGPKFDIAVLNAAAAIAAGGMAKNIKEAIPAAIDSVERGKAFSAFMKLKEITNASADAKK